MADINSVEQWALETWPNEPPDEVKRGVKAAVDSNPQASDDEVKAQIVKAANSAPSNQTNAQQAQPDARTALYQSLKDKYLSPGMGDQGRAEALKQAQSTQTPGWKTNLGAALMSVASGLNPKVGSAGEYRQQIASQDTKNYNRVMGEYDKKKSSIVEDIRNISMLDAAERNAQAADPNSMLSQGLRNAMSTMMPSIAKMPNFDKMSAVELERLSPMVTNWYKTQISKQLAEAQMANQRAIADVKKKTATPQLSEAEKTYDRESTKSFTKKMDELPKIEQREQNIDDALKVADKVITGPVAGENVFQTLQKIGTKEAQKLEYFLSQENIALIMDFAAKAGVRAIDTPQEQKRLLASIANRNMSGDVLKEVLRKMKYYLSESARLVKEEKQYREKNNYSSRGFTPTESKPYVYGQGEEDSSAPYGDTVRQNGVTYKWNGTEYVEVK